MERLEGDRYYPPPPLRSSPLSQGDKEGEKLMVNVERWTLTDERKGKMEFEEVNG